MTTTEIHDSAKRISVPARLEVSNRNQFKQTVLDAVAAGARTVTIDFAGTGYVDSSALGMLVSLARACQRAEATLELTGLDEDLRALIRYSGIDTILVIAGGSLP
jgi:anti-sigma B factor antagonist